MSQGQAKTQGVVGAGGAAQKERKLEYEENGAPRIYTLDFIRIQYEVEKPEHYIVPPQKTRIQKIQDLGIVGYAYCCMQKTIDADQIPIRAIRPIKTYYEIAKAIPEKYKTEPRFLVFYERATRMGYRPKGKGFKYHDEPEEGAAAATRKPDSTTRKPDSTTIRAPTGLPIAKGPRTAAIVEQLTSDVLLRQVRSRHAESSKSNSEVADGPQTNFGGATSGNPVPRQGTSDKTGTQGQMHGKGSRPIATAPNSGGSGDGPGAPSTAKGSHRETVREEHRAGRGRGRGRRPLSGHSPQNRRRFERELRAEQAARNAELGLPPPEGTTRTNKRNYDGLGFQVCDDDYLDLCKDCNFKDDSSFDGSEIAD